MLIHRPVRGPRIHQNSRIIVTKSNPSTSAMGYDKKASLLMTRYYIIKTHVRGILINQRALMKNFTNILSVLYTYAMHRELPGVKDGTTKSLSGAILRKDKNKVSTRIRSRYCIE